MNFNTVWRILHFTRLRKHQFHLSESTMFWPMWDSYKPRRIKLREPVERHLGVRLTDAQSVSHEMKPIERVNLQRVIDRWTAASKPAAVVCGYTSAGYVLDDQLVKNLVTDELIQAPVERIQLECGPGEMLDCMLRGLCLLRRNNVSLLIGFRTARFTGDLPVMDIVASTREAARDTLGALLNEAAADNAYRGRTISIDSSGSWKEEIVIRFQSLRPTSRDDIVLPEELIEVVERNVLGMLKHGAALRSAGRNLRHGLLFHGPPGTGKSMMVRYLAQACREHTIILLTGTQQGIIRQSCHIARLLAPSIVVLEDVDLIAEDREQNRCPVILHELMNEMDGLGPHAEVIFLLTTNRPEMLETALSARPGRIDQAIAFPLPDDKCRRRLFEVYGRGLDLSAFDVDRWVAQTNGVSPAFIEELLRKAALLAAERGEPGPALRLTDTDAQNAIRELVYFGGELTQKLLGYRTGRIGYQAEA